MAAIVTTAQQVLDIARSQLGTVESASGSNPYGRSYGVDKVAWCAQFVWWCFQQAGGSGLTHPKTAYCPTLADWYRGRGQWFTTPQVGDLVFFDWPDSDRALQHVGLVEVVEATSIVTIEGNTSSGMAGSQSNGGGVWRRRRDRNASAVGYGRPAYDTSREEDMPLNPDDLQQIRDVVKNELAALWTAPIPDFYAKPGPDGKPTTLPAFAAVGWAAANAGHAADSARDAVKRGDEIVGRLATGTGGAAPDYDALVRTFAAELLNRLPQ